MNRELIGALLELARQRQFELDVLITAWRAGDGKGLRLWCGPGCGNCCSLTVNATLPEAWAIAAVLDGEQRRQLAMAAARITAHAAACGDARSFLAGYRQAVGPCPFLDETGSCTIYPHRPLACRALLATRPPDWCGINLAQLAEIERNGFLASLDRDHVAFPTHYAAAPQQMAADLERGLTFAMLRCFGFGVTGNLPLLAHLAGQPGFAESLSGGVSPFRVFLAKHGTDYPFLVQLDVP